MRNLETGELKALQRAYASFSTRYRERKGVLALKSDFEAKAYALARAPATVGVLAKIAAEIDFENASSFLDIGAGTGAGIDLALENGFSKITALEINFHMAKVLEENYQTEAVKIHKTNALSTPFDKHDVTLISYVLNELKPSEQKHLLEKAIKATNETLILIEAGTKLGYETLLAARETLLNSEFNLIAPCTHALTCPLIGDDWCHFKTRINRTKLHKDIKQADTPFEDEPYSYLVYSKTQKNAGGKRVLLPPAESKVDITVKVCEEQGRLEILSLARRDKQAYKKASKLNWGDLA